MLVSDKEQERDLGSVPDEDGTPARATASVAAVKMHFLVSTA